MDVVSWLLSKSYVDKTVIGMGAIKGSPATIQSIVDNLDGTHDITFAWKDTLDVTHTSVLTVMDGDKGDKGDPGNDYILTSQDKADIADIVLGELTEAESEEV